jgi:hypothetical protein
MAAKQLIRFEKYTNICLKDVPMAFCIPNGAAFYGNN